MGRIRSDALRMGLACGLTWIASAAPAAARHYATPEFSRAESRPKTLAVLPPRAEFVKAKVVMSEEMVKECEALEAAALDRIGVLLQEKGYTVRPLPPGTVNADPDLRELIFRVNERYEEEWQRFVRKPGRIREGRYNLGEDPVEIADHLGVDGILVPRVVAVAPSKGVKTLSIILGGYAQGYVRLDLSVVSGETGDLEAFYFTTVTAGMKGLTKNPDRIMEKAAGSALRRYPEVNETLPYEESTEGRETAEEEVDEEEVLEELEVLLGPEEEKENKE
ncbi:MAG: hypothetical protein HY509_01325 [Acidobacteria bacterium]|nr:hypothetical protein [Acidobacteriota bacterium]